MQLIIFVNDNEIELHPPVPTRAQLPTFDGKHMRVKNVEEMVNVNEVYAKPSETNFGYASGCILLLGIFGMMIGSWPGALAGMLIGAGWGTINHVKDLIAVKKFNRS